MALVGVYTPMDECIHIFDAAYMVGGSYADAYLTCSVIHNSLIAISAYREHREHRANLTKWDF